MNSVLHNAWLVTAVEGVDGCPRRERVASIFILSIRPPSLSTLFPYTTLFRSRYGSSHIGATAKDISNVVTDAASGDDIRNIDRKSGSAGMPRPISYAVFCLKKKTITKNPEE